MLNQETVRAHLGAHEWRDLVQVLPLVDSTNTQCKALAAQGAPEGTVMIADAQSGGRGRLGRSFSSPAGQGIYLSVILRPECPPTDLTHLTAVAAVAVCDAVEKACGLRPKIKWTNDLVVEKKKLCGILTELSIRPDGITDYAVVGIGLNCAQTPEDFPEEIRDIATSLRLCTGAPVDRAKLASHVVAELATMRRNLFSDREQTLKRYAEDCITIGQRVRIVRADEERFALATGIDSDACLQVQYDDGTEGIIATGEVSVRGMYGYL
ncbi:MAG: biotin--[acetyl-CoA-carboxylase] ligase [Ruminococcaceae bacterium]|nr:biotin--[acetyl-CoA-carboxylase] ligase [Oscillospiraceae bacterium]